MSSQERSSLPLQGGRAPTEAQLDHARTLADPAADALLAELAGLDVLGLLEAVTTQDDPLPKTLPAPLRRFLEQETGLPSWVHAELIRTAQWWADDHRYAIASALFCATLPALYATECSACFCKPVPKGRADGLRTSTAEIARFVFEVIETGSLQGQGRAIRACQKLRLANATARRRPRSSTVTDAGETPLNQEQLLGTWLGFSVITLEAAKKLQTSCARNGEEAYYQLWRALSGLVGLPDELMPTSLSQATVLADRILARRVRSTARARTQSTSLLTALQKCLTPYGVEHMPEQLSSELSDPRVRRALGLRAPRVQCADPLRDTILDQNGPPSRSVTRNVSRLVGRALFDGWISAAARTPAAHVEPPARERWGLTA